MPRIRFGLGAGIVVAVACVSGCPSREKRSAPDASVQMHGLKLPLPEGWVARPESEDVLLVGPPQDPLLRIRRADVDALPSPEKLRAAFSDGFGGGTLVTGAESATEEGVFWRGTVEHGSGRTLPAMLAARKVGGEVVLCSSIAGASEQEVEAAAQACESIGGP